MRDAANGYGGNKQAIFDDVATHLLTQGKKATSLQHGYDYVNPDGLRCAIGGIIPDTILEQISNTGRSQWIGMLIKDFDPDGVVANFFGVDANDANAVNFLGELQQVHDTSTPEDWPGDLTLFATRHSLNNSVVLAFEQKAT